jgi:hypothetical protein
MTGAAGQFRRAAAQLLYFSTGTTIDIDAPAGTPVPIGSANLSSQQWRDHKDVDRFSFTLATGIIKCEYAGTVSVKAVVSGQGDAAAHQMTLQLYKNQTAVSGIGVAIDEDSAAAGDQASPIIGLVDVEADDELQIYFDSDASGDDIDIKGFQFVVEYVAVRE